jgi:AraC family transcriptional regulator
MYGLTPGGYRKRRIIKDIFEPLNLMEKYLASDPANMIDPRIKVLKQLKAMRVAYYRAVGKNPELDAWKKLHAWAKKTGPLKDTSPYRIFGFDNPGPKPGQSSHGYELWFTVGPDIEAAEDIGIKTFPGGLYAVTGTTVADIGEAWKHFVDWQKISKYRRGKHQCFEEILSPIGTSEQDIKIDLYLPIKKP